MTAHWPRQNVPSGTRSDARKRIIEELEQQEAEQEKQEALADLNIPKLDRRMTPK